MGFKGKLVGAGRRVISSRAGRAALLGGGAAAVGAAGFGAGGGGAPVPKGGTGLYRVRSDGSIVKVSLPRKRRRGYRMPRVVADQLRASTDLTRAMSIAIAGRLASGD